MGKINVNFFFKYITGELATEKYRYAIEELIHDENQAEIKEAEERRLHEERMMHRVGVFKNRNSDFF